jgi:hypothetical protein
MESFDELLVVLNYLTTRTNSVDGACYVRQVGTQYQCILCGLAHCISREQFLHHMLEPGHLQKLHRFKQSLDRAICIVTNFDINVKQRTFERLEKLGRTIWSDAVRASLLRHLTTAHSLSEVKELLDKYEYLEPQALLGLAVWKSECIKQMPDDCTGFLSSHQWIFSGWKVLKKDHRDSNAMSIVVLSVRPFLDPPRDRVKHRGA